MLLDAVAQNLVALAEQSNQVIFVYDTTAQKFSYLNAAFERVWRKKRKSVLNIPGSLVKMVHPEDQQHEDRAYYELLEGIINPEVEFWIKLRNHTEKWLCLKPLVQEEQGMISGYVQDITAQRLYNDYLKKYSNKKNSFLNILSPDLAGPLGLISNVADMLQSDLKSNQDQDIHNLVRLIRKSSQQGLQLIQEFMKQEFLESSGVEATRSRQKTIKI